MVAEFREIQGWISQEVNDVLLPLKRQTIEEVMYPHVCLGHFAGIYWGRCANFMRGAAWCGRIITTAAAAAAGSVCVAGLWPRNSIVLQRDIHSVGSTIGLAVTIAKYVTRL